MKDMLNRFGDYDKKKTSFGLIHWDLYNFRVITFTNPLRKITKQLKGDLQIDCSKEIKDQMNELPENFVFFNYPQAEGRNVFLHGILFHELGHAIDWKKKISKKIIKAVNWPANNVLDDPLLPVTFGNWVEEIAADLIATQLWGPCVLFSSRLTSLAVGVMDADSHTHPSSRFRLQWILDHLNKMGYMDEKNKTNTSKTLYDWLKKLQNYKFPNSSPHYDTVRSMLMDKDIVEKLHASVDEAFAGQGFTSEKFGEYVPKVVENFRDQLPDCGEGIDPVTHMTSVFNAIWEKNFQKHSEDVVGSALFAEREILCNLALKSIEANYIQNLWSEK